MKKILVIDDEEPIRMNIQMILTRNGYQPIVAKNGFEGIASAKIEIPDLIICDVLMPGCDGYSVLENLRNHPPTALIPFIFLTGKTEVDDLRKGMLLGGDDYITKPFKIKEIIEAVNIQINKHEKIIQQAENAKWESEERFKAIFNYAPMGIALVNPASKIVKVNDTYAGILGFTPEELYTQTVIDISDPEDVEQTILMNEKVKTGEIKHYTVEKRYKCKGGYPVWVNLSVSGVYKKNGNLSFFISMIQDITEKKMNEMESLKAERLQTIGKMAAMLTHEIKTPLTSIRMNADLLMSSTILTDNNKKSIFIIKKEAKRLTNLVKDVLQFANQMDLEKKDFPLNKLFDDIILSFESIIKPLNIQIVNNTTEDNFRGDYEKLTSAFSAIINNSVEAIGENGLIEISSVFNVLISQLSIYIKDNGCGIKLKEKIFEPFYTSKASGTGLGLIISQKIFQQHSGNIMLKSSAPGETIFEIIFSLKG